MVIARFGRVALGDEIAEILGGKLCVLLVGERPGLSVADSLGVYITYDPRPGRRDSERNCISNIHANGGLSLEQAAATLCWLARAALARHETGVSRRTRARAFPSRRRSKGRNFGRLPKGRAKRREMMSFISSIVRRAATWTKNSWALLLILAVQLVGASPGFADPAQKRDSSDEARVAALAKQWFVDMQQGKVDRSQYAPAYAAQITDGAVQAMSGNLNRYGAPPLRVEIAKTRRPAERRLRR